jgi:hypothetical protein
MGVIKPKQANPKKVVGLSCCPGVALQSLEEILSVSALH